MTAPDFIEPLIGYRAWMLSSRAELVPWALMGAGAWAPGENSAVCHAGRNHHAPATNCMCGLYALAAAGDWRLHGREGQIVGAIAAWGDVELHRTGFRAEKAAVVALAEPADGDPALAEQAAERYDVPLVPRGELELTARRFGRPVDPSVLDDPADRDVRLHHGDTGIAIVEHMWCKPEAAMLTLGITRAFASQLDDNIEITLPPAGTRVAARDPLATLSTRYGNLIAWACASGQLYERNERLLRDPSLLRDDPESGGWLARLIPSAWPAEARNFSWGPAGKGWYAAELGRAASGHDIYADLRAERIFAGPPADGMIDIVAELRRRRAEPRFKSEADVYAVCAEPVRERLARSRRLRAGGVVVRYRVSEPAAELTLATIDDEATLTCGSTSTTPTLTVSMTAETAAKHFAGRLDIARALRAGLVTSDRPRVETLRTMALLKPLFSQP